MSVLFKSSLALTSCSSTLMLPGTKVAHVPVMMWGVVFFFSFLPCLRLFTSQE